MWHDQWEPLWAAAQDLEPRAYAPAPVGTSFALLRSSPTQSGGSPAGSHTDPAV